jgi:hypothetical protein
MAIWAKGIIFDASKAAQVFSREGSWLSIRLSLVGSYRSTVVKHFWNGRAFRIRPVCLL